MGKKCLNCGTDFEITERDESFLKRIDMPHPTLCPECRSIRRLSFRNERILYNRKCSLSGKPIISVYDENVKFPVYDHEVWHGDGWDALDYGQDFDFGRGFFEQFAILYSKVPRINFMNQASENSDYCNYAYRNKNCYLIFGSHYNEDSQYENYAWKTVNCFDNLEVIQSELVYEGIYSDGCYSCAYAEYCFDCSDCKFCYDLIGCKNCLFSCNLRNKQYYIFNKPYSKEEYEKMAKEFYTGSFSNLGELIKKFNEVKAIAIRRNLFQKNCENCLGNDIQNSKNLYYGFNVKYAEDCSYLYMQNTHVKDSMDLNCIGYDDSEVLYECIGNSGNFYTYFCNSCWHNSNITYCEQCFDSKNLFGCIGLHHKQYCILNKQYSKEEYEDLLAKIIENMKKDSQYGEFFPTTLSPFAHNETMANVYYPLTKEEALKKGLKWKDPNPKEYKPQTYSVPDDISDVPELVINEILACSECKKNYKITPLELKFYKKTQLPIPRKCPNCRHIARVNLQTKPRFFERDCGKCGKKMLTTYPPKENLKVYCEKCYLDEVY